MTLRRYLLLLAIGTAAAASASVVVLVGIDPVTAGWPAFIVLYLTVGATAAGLITLLGTALRLPKLAHTDIRDVIGRSLRQGIFLAFTLLLTLWLSAHRALNIWTAVLLILLVTGVEYFFLISAHRSQKRHES